MVFLIYVGYSILSLKSKFPPQHSVLKDLNLHVHLTAGHHIWVTQQTFSNPYLLSDISCSMQKKWVFFEGKDWNDASPLPRTNVCRIHSSHYYVQMNLGLIQRHLSMFNEADSACPPCLFHVCSSLTSEVSVKHNAYGYIEATCISSSQARESDLLRGTETSVYPWNHLKNDLFLISFRVWLFRFNISLPVCSINPLKTKFV